MTCLNDVKKVESQINHIHKATVRDGYDAVSYAYRGDVEAEDCVLYHRWLDELLPLLKPGTPVLDLGCGCGIPVAKRLAHTHRVTGVDISPVQIQRARCLVPDARFLCADMTALTFPTDHFEAIVSFYAIIHIPLDEQPRLFEVIKRWLKPGGYLMINVGHTQWTGIEQDWLGVPGGTMYWSQADATTYTTWLRDNSFTVRWTRFVPEDDSGHTLILAWNN